MTDNDHESSRTHPLDKPVVIDDATLRQWIANCDPQTPMDPSDTRYCDLDQAVVDGETVALRGDDHIEGLYDAITLSEESSCQLFSGFSGTGKSTELRRLTRLLEDDGYTVLLVDAQEYHDLNHQLTISDLLLVVAGAFGEATSARLGKDVIKESYWQRFYELLHREIELGDIRLPAGITDLKLGIRHEEPFWRQVRSALAGNLGKLRDHSHRFVQRCVATLEKAEGSSRGVVFILDSLERLTAPVLHFREVIESVVRVLTHYPDFLRLPGCHVIYTVPPYAQLISPGLKDRYDRASLVLPAIKVLERGDSLTPYRPGINALSELIARRIPVERVFGSRHDLLDRLVVYSGGHVRMLISFIRELLIRARRRGLPPTKTEIERIVQPFREQAGTAIWRESVPLLDRILRQGTIEGIREEEYPYLARFMDNYVVLCCRNGDGWYEVHPLAREIVERLAAQLGGTSRKPAVADRPSSSPLIGLAPTDRRPAIRSAHL